LSVVQCLHKRETRAVLRKKGPVHRRAMPGRTGTLYPEFLSEGTRLKSVKSGKALYPGSAISGKKHTLLLRALPKGLTIKSVKGGKALYPGSVILEFYCTDFIVQRPSEFPQYYVKNTVCLNCSRRNALHCTKFYMNNSKYNVEKLKLIPFKVY